jgi:cyclopropane fatty-acyl-phospholipid synthase-like methyltransferase
MASESAKYLKRKPKFLIQDANNLSIKEKYDFVLALEMISHLKNRNLFFKRASKILKKGGKFCIAAWIKSENLSKSQIKEEIVPIEKGMLVSLPTIKKYEEYASNNNLKIIYCEDISKEVKKTWDIGSNLIKNISLWQLVLKHPREFLSFVTSIQSMRRGFSSGALRYYLIIMQKRP